MIDSSTHEFVGDFSVSPFCVICSLSPMRHQGQTRIIFREIPKGQVKGYFFTNEQTIDEMVEEMIQKFNVERKQNKQAIEEEKKEDE